MIVRKPYAFLIKNFRKLHVGLLIAAIYIFMKNSQAISFLDEFSSDGAYNPVVEPISRYFGFPTFFIIIAMIAIMGFFGYLLRQRDKPWKSYLILILIYVAAFFVFMYVSAYFGGYSSNDFNKATARLLHDLVLIVSFPQYLSFILLLIRITGVDLQKFDFASDYEALEITDRDKEEVEISFDFDKNVIARMLQKLRRNLEYFYFEHKFIMNICIVVVTVLVIGNIYYYFGVTHRSYRQGSTLKVSGYEITVNKSYYTTRDYMGRTVEKGKAFVVLDMTIKNNNKSEVFKMDNFHLMNWSDDYTYTIFYNESFNDLGKLYANDKWQPNKTYHFMLVFKVNERNAFSNFVLYYQEYHNRFSTYLRKMKLRVQDLSDVKEIANVKLNKEITFEDMKGNKKSIIFTDSEIGKKFTYNIYKCDIDSCQVKEDKIEAREGYKILKLTFESADFEGKDFVDFSTKYGKISYVDNKGKDRSADIVDYIDAEYQGRYLYLKVPNNLNPDKKIELTYVIRNKKYVYKIK